MPCRASSPRPAHVRAQAVMLRGGGTRKNQMWIPPTTPAARGHLARATGGHLTSRGGFWKQGSSCLRSEPGCTAGTWAGRQGSRKRGPVSPTQAARNQAIVYPSRVVCMGAQLHLPTGDQLLGLDKQGFKEWWVGRVGLQGWRASRGPGVPDVCWDKAHGFEGLLSNPSPSPSHPGGQAASPCPGCDLAVGGRAMSSLGPATLRVSPESASSSVRCGDKAVALNEMRLQGAEGAGERSPPSRTPRDSSAPQTMPASCSPPPCLHGEMRGLGSLKPNKKGISGSGSPVSN